MKRETNKTDMTRLEQGDPELTRIAALFNIDSAASAKRRVSQIGALATVGYGALGVGFIATGDAISGIEISTLGFMIGASSVLPIRRVNKMQDEEHKQQSNES